MNKTKLVNHLKKAIAAFEKGKGLFENGDFSKFPKGKKEKIMVLCKECNRNMKAAQEIDKFYAKVYQQFSDGGTETNCRLAKNRWCFAKQQFVQARIKGLGSK